MPIYEYRCRSCNRKSSRFFQVITEQPEASCPHCDSKDMRRLISSFAYHGSEQDIVQEMERHSESPMDYYKDPRVIGRWTEKRLAELRMEVPSEIRETIEAAWEGEMPKALDI